MPVIISCLISIQNREPSLCGLVKNLNIGLYSDIYRLISFTFGLMIETIEFTF